jgi:TonB family protein
MQLRCSKWRRSLTQPCPENFWGDLYFAILHDTREAARSMHVERPAFFVMLLAALFGGQVQGKEARGDKPVVYNRVGKDSNPAEESTVRRKYETKFQIVDIGERRSFVLPKWPKQEKRPPPPRDASGRVLRGTLRLVSIINSEGSVMEPFILRSSNQLLNAPVLREAKQWHFTPARLDGSPVATLVVEDLIFDPPPLPEWIRAVPDTIAIDAKGVRHLLSDYPTWPKDVTKRVEPKYHREFSSDGHGLFRVMIDLKTGSVTNVLILRSTDSETLDKNACVALRQWRWKPATWKQVDIPVTFEPAGQSPIGRWRGGKEYHPLEYHPQNPPYYPPGTVR